MKTLQKVYFGLEVLLGVGATDIALGKDEVYVGGTGCGPEALTPEAQSELEELGWYWDKEFESWRRCV